jgi:hypothetical protein
MPKPIVTCVPLAILAIGLNACTPQAQLAVTSGFGPHPELPAPQHGLIPTIKIAPAKPRLPGEAAWFLESRSAERI